MAYQRGKFGIEYSPVKRSDSSPTGAIAAVVVSLILVCAGVMLVRRVTSRLAPGTPDGEPPETVLEPPAPVVPLPVRVEPPSAKPVERQPEPELSSTQVIAAASAAMAEPAKRPQNVRNLLLRLETAERDRNVEMAVTTIEQLRALPGSPVADIDDSLARRLSVLNLRRLYEIRNPQWVKSVTVKGGDSLERIARENGATLASTVRLNPSINPDRIRVGQTVCVMNHPRFNLIVHRRAKTADLNLNGKLFRRYDLADEVKASAGAHEFPAKPRRFWADQGIALGANDRAEIEALLPAGTPILISEL